MVEVPRDEMEMDWLAFVTVNVAALDVSELVTPVLVFVTTTRKRWPLSLSDGVVMTRVAVVAPVMLPALLREE